MERFLNLFTFLEDQEIAQLSAAHRAARKSGSGRRSWRKRSTRIVHGDEALAQASKASEVLFGGEMWGLADRDLAEIFANVPRFTVSPEALDRGWKVTDAMVAAEAAKSKGEAARLIAGGGVYLNNKRVEAADALLNRESLASATMFVLRVGKKSFFLGKVSFETEP